MFPIIDTTNRITAVRWRFRFNQRTDCGSRGQSVRCAWRVGLVEVPAVVEEHVRPPSAGTEDRPLDAPPVLLLGLPLPGEHRDPGRGHRGGSVVLRREDVARRPRTSAPSAMRVSMRTAVWIVMCRQPAFPRAVSCRRTTRASR